MLRNRFPESPPAPREGMAEMFTLQRLKLPPSLYKCLATIQPGREPAEGCGAPDRQWEVSAWSGTAGRWVAPAWLLTENRFRKVSGHRDLWALATILRDFAAPVEEG